VCATRAATIALASPSAGAAKRSGATAGTSIWRAAAGLERVAEVTARAGVHRRDELERRREHGLAGGAETTIRPLASGSRSASSAAFAQKRAPEERRAFPWCSKGHATSRSRSIVGQCACQQGLARNVRNGDRSQQKSRNPR